MTHKKSARNFGAKINFHQFCSSKNSFFVTFWAQKFKKMCEKFGAKIRKFAKNGQNLHKIVILLLTEDCQYCPLCMLGPNLYLPELRKMVVRNCFTKSVWWGFHEKMQCNYPFFPAQYIKWLEMQFLCIESLSSHLGGIRATKLNVKTFK